MVHFHTPESQTIRICPWYTSLIFTWEALLASKFLFISSAKPGRMKSNYSTSNRDKIINQLNIL